MGLCRRMRRCASTHSFCEGVIKALPSISALRQLKLSMTTPTKRFVRKSANSTMAATKYSAFAGCLSRTGCPPHSAAASVAAYIWSGQPSKVEHSKSSCIAIGTESKLGTGLTHAHPSLTDPHTHIASASPAGMEGSARMAASRANTDSNSPSASKQPASRPPNWETPRMAITSRKKIKRKSIDNTLGMERSSDCTTTRSPGRR
mmetsp:Transcript_5407/g.14144  ORF Transcript_5407/g.14144 Transcript_5407/m.14144 type:complete len:204 (+) Transcript_5407:629-1240(+)